MSGWGRVAVAVGALAAVVVLFFVFRSGGDDDETATPPPPPARSPATAETETTETAETGIARTEPPPPPPPPPGPVRARIEVAGGEVVGGRRVLRVRQGRRVVLTVVADVADHAHLHGYDLFADVAPGMPARIRFRATIPGRFEIELEDRAMHIAELQVRP